MSICFQTKFSPTLSISLIAPLVFFIVYTVRSSANSSNIIIVKAVFSFPKSKLLIIALELKVSALGLLFLIREPIPFFITGAANEIIDNVLKLKIFFNPVIGSARTFLNILYANNPPAAVIFLIISSGDSSCNFLSITICLLFSIFSFLYISTRYTFSVFCRRAIRFSSVTVISVKYITMVPVILLIFALLIYLTSSNCFSIFCFILPRYFNALDFIRILPLILWTTSQDKRYPLLVLSI